MSFPSRKRKRAEVTDENNSGSVIFTQDLALQSTFQDSLYHNFCEVKSPVTPRRDFVTDLQTWSVNNKIPLSKTSSLLEILNYHNKHDNLPKGK